MKRIYMTLALIGGLSFGASAQNIDLEAIIDMADGQCLPATGTFSPDTTYVGEGATADSVYAIWGIANNGPEAILTDDQILYMSSYSSYLTEEEAAEEGVPFEDRYFWLNGITMTENVVAGDYAAVYSYSGISDIGMVGDWDRWEQYGCDSSFILYGAPHDTYVDGQEYGFFMRIYGIGAATDAIINTDADLCNNRKAVRVIWNGDCGSGISEMIAPKEKVSLTVYPNPSAANLNFNFDLDKSTDVTVVVRDAVGRTVMTKNYGKMNIGVQNFQVDISSLDAGLYTIELGTAYISALSKFTKL